MYRSRTTKNTCTEIDDIDLICTEIVMYRNCPPLCTETVMYRKRRNPAPNTDGRRLPRMVLDWETCKVLSVRASTSDGIAGCRELSVECILIHLVD